jgi:predicted sugar kinase
VALPLLLAAVLAAGQLIRGRLLLSAAGMAASLTVPPPIPLLVAVVRQDRAVQDRQEVTLQQRLAPAAIAAAAVAARAVVCLRLAAIKQARLAVTAA